MNKKILIIGIMISVLFILGSYYAIAKTSAPEVAVKSYTKDDASKPKVETNETSFDMGKIKVSEEKSAKFTIKNIGTEPLQLTDISTSCGCTVGVISYDGKKSPEFGMHTAGDFTSPIEPGTEATVEVIYRPFVMPVYGPVTRELYISTNDPENPKLTFQVAANVN